MSKVVGKVYKTDPPAGIGPGTVPTNVAEFGPVISQVIGMLETGVHAKLYTSTVTD